MYTHAKSADTKKPLIALDGPSALALFRDRDDRAHQASDSTYDPLFDDDWAYYDDPIFVAGLHVFGGTSGQSWEQSSLDYGVPELVRTRSTSLSRCTNCSRNIKTVPFDSLGLRPPEETSPLYLLAASSKAKRTVLNVRQRALGNEIPRDSFRRLGDCVLVPTPEFCFLLLAGHVNLIELITLGMEMCGHYRLVGGPTSRPTATNRTVYGCNRLTTPDKLRAYAEHMRGFPGRSLALRACKYIVGESCSPMETAIYLLLCLPRRMGGYALSRPSLNAKRKVNGYAESFTLSRNLIPDLYWASVRLDVEYDSDGFHSDPLSLRKGAHRTLALRTMHVDVIALTSDMVHDEETFAGVARLIAKKVGKRLPPNGTKRAARLALREAVLA